MKYDMKSHPTRYKNVLFRSRLEARWAAFFDTQFMSWLYEPVDLDGWTPDFRVSIECVRCDKTHYFYAEVKPYDLLEEFANHPSQCFNKPGQFDVVHLGIDPLTSSKFYLPHHPTFVALCDKPDNLYSLTDLHIFQTEEQLLEDWAEAGNLTMYRRPKE